MKINANLICERLKEKYPVIMYGNPFPEITLRAPEFYRDNMTRFKSGRLYLATVEHLPYKPVIEKDVILVCIGESSHLSYYKEHASVIQIRRKVDFFEVFQSLQGICSVFFEWESRVLELLTKEPDIQEILNSSYALFHCPLYVLNESFQFAASVRTSVNMSDPARWNPDKNTVDFRQFLDFLKEQNMSMEKKGAFLLEFETGNVLCCNLFNTQDQYMGCLCIDQQNHSYIPGEDSLACRLAEILERAADITPSLLKNEHNSLKDILQTMMQEMPLTHNQKVLLKSFNNKQQYFCLSLHYLKQFSSLPVRYLCSVLENSLSGSAFFELNNTLLGLVPVENTDDNKADSAVPEKILSALIHDLQLCIGISNRFDDLYMLRTYYRQAEAAIDNGLLYCPGKSLYYFSDYILQELISDATSRFPLEAYFPEGFQALAEHDKTAGVSYLETLAVYLEENMSYAKAARRLFIHRSTLIERISRIESDLSLDLADPEQRLQLMIVLKALELSKNLNRQPLP